MPPPLDAEIDSLYAVPAAEFIRARNALVRQLRSAGRAADAARIQRVRKPSAPLWALNQVSRRFPGVVARLVDSVERLRRAQLQSPGTLAEATERHRAALRDLTQRAAEILSAAGVPAPPAVVGRISSTAMGAATDRERREDLKRGRLSEELQAPGFEAFAGAPASRRATVAFLRERPRPPAPTRSETSAPAARPDETQRAREALRQATAAARTATRHAKAREQNRRRRQQAADRARAALETVRRRLADAERRADTTAREAEQASRAAEEATRAAAEAAHAVERAQRAAERAVPPSVPRPRLASRATRGSA